MAHAHQNSQVTVQLGRHYFHALALLPLAWSGLAWPPCISVPQPLWLFGAKWNAMRPELLVLPINGPPSCRL